MANPFLPLNTYIADGEPHVFGNRVYLFGSHDKAGGDTYCMRNYEFWSAPVEDLETWSCKGVSYRADQDLLYGEMHCQHFTRLHSASYSIICFASCHSYPFVLHQEKSKIVVNLLSPQDICCQTFRC